MFRYPRASVTVATRSKIRNVATEISVAAPAEARWVGHTVSTVTNYATSPLVRACPSQYSLESHTIAVLALVPFVCRRHFFPLMVSSWDGGCQATRATGVA